MPTERNMDEIVSAVRKHGAVVVRGVELRDACDYDRIEETGMRPMVEKHGVGFGSFAKHEDEEFLLYDNRSEGFVPQVYAIIHRVVKGKVPPSHSAPHGALKELMRIREAVSGTNKNQLEG